MWLLMLSLVVQTPSPRQVLEAEHARGADISVLMRAARGSDQTLRARAVRAIGRFERPALRDSVVPFVTDKSPQVRLEAINALGQMKAPFDFVAPLSKELRSDVRAMLLSTMGRSSAATGSVEQTLATHLGAAARDATERLGAARGLESLLRRTARSNKPTASTVQALRQAFRANRGEEMRQLVLLALTAAGDRDSSTMALALRDSSAQVRRLAVAATRQWLDDPSPFVRYQALRVAGTCERALASLRDGSEHVALAAIDLIGEKSCDANTYASTLQMVMSDGTTWRMRAHALVALARIAPALAQPALAASATSRTWQERVYAATAAKLLHDSATLAALARDNAPNVAIAAMSNTDDALRALSSDHAGLLLAAAAQLKGSTDLPRAVAPLRATADRLLAQKRSTQRDPLVAIAERLREAGSPIVVPAVADYPIEPLPSEAFLAGLDGAMLKIRFRGLGTITMELFPDEAPLTVATLVQLADSGKFTGLTLHRIVPNFVVQGGSPGADEYDGISSGFMRDEVGLRSHKRGTLGISTRGRDTGDGQLFINLVDNFRLDHDYTVFARITSGLSLIDRIEEGDGIQAVEVVRRVKK